MLLHVGKALHSGHTVFALDLPHVLIPDAVHLEHVILHGRLGQVSVIAVSAFDDLTRGAVSDNHVFGQLVVLLHDGHALSTFGIIEQIGVLVFILNAMSLRSEVKITMLSALETQRLLPVSLVAWTKRLLGFFF